MSDVITMTREELYEEVWTTPATQLAKKYGMSDVGFGKLCKRYNIPKPDRGYWSQIKAGYTPARTKLPKMNPEGQVVVFHIPLYGNRDYPPEVDQAGKAMLRKKERIIVPSELSNPHPLVEKTIQILKRTNEYTTSGVPNYQRLNCLKLMVTRSMLNRAARIMDAFIKKLESLGHSVEVTKEDRFSMTLALIGEQEIPFHISEADKKLNPTGKLAFLIGGTGHPAAKDEPDLPLEDQLNVVLAELIRLAAIKRIQEEEWEQERAKRLLEDAHKKELEELKEADLRRFAAVADAADSWAKSERLRAFIDRCEQEILKRLTPIPPDSMEAKWLCWARAHAASLDPLPSGFLDEAVPQVTGQLPPTHTDSLDW